MLIVHYSIIIYMQCRHLAVLYLRETRIHIYFDSSLVVDKTQDRPKYSVHAAYLQIHIIMHEHKHVVYYLRLYAWG